MPDIPHITLRSRKILSDRQYRLEQITLEIRKENGTPQTWTRECFDRGNGAVILLYDPDRKTVILTRQFRLPAYINGTADGMLVEACAGELDEDSPEDCIRREALEETGYLVQDPQKLFELYMSPGSVTEVLHFFIARYSPDSRKNSGGGVEGEEDIEVLEIPFNRALDMVRTGKIRDAKTVILLQHMRLQNLM
ncbi:MAG: GDP-mannose pyrophosphatase NudK [Pseudomonadota bacterium]|nr:GDP-mannose pyrophosphatase NudK [Pseudomonadota bacterium]